MRGGGGGRGAFVGVFENFLEIISLSPESSSAYCLDRRTKKRAKNGRHWWEKFAKNIPPQVLCIIQSLFYLLLQTVEKMQGAVKHTSFQPPIPVDRIVLYLDPKNDYKMPRGHTSSINLSPAKKEKGEEVGTGALREAREWVGVRGR